MTKERFALATVVKASKPSPRGVGATLAIHEDGCSFIGSVSAGCVENEVIEASKACLETGKIQWLSFGPGEGFPWEIELSCGGQIEVRVEPVPLLGDERLFDCLESHSRGMLVSGNAGHALIDDANTERGCFSEEIIEEARRRYTECLPTEETEFGGERILFRQLGKRERLFVIGASHIAINLVAVAKTLQYEVIVVEPRESYARENRFLNEPDALIGKWPSEALDGYELGEEDALVAITHDPKIDDQALEFALNTNCGYIGALGSRKSHAARCRRLARKDFNEASLARIHGPVGIDIGSRTPAEIAVSIVAQLISSKSERRRAL